MRLLTMRQVAELLELKGNPRKITRKAIRVLRALEKTRRVALIVQVGQGQGSAARYATTEDALRRAAPEIFRASRIPPEVIEELERLRRSDVQIRARIGELSRKVEELSAVRVMTERLTIQ
jgi:hypothetical protein